MTGSHQVAKAQSGKWHLLGQRGCLSVSSSRIKSDSIESIRGGKRNRDWCFYCEQTLRLIDLEREIKRLQALLANPEQIPVRVAAGQTTKQTYHPNPDCPHLTGSTSEWPLRRAIRSDLTPCQHCLGTVHVGANSSDDARRVRQTLLDMDPQQLSADGGIEGADRLREEST